MTSETPPSPLRYFLGVSKFVQFVAMFLFIFWLIAIVRYNIQANEVDIPTLVESDRNFLQMVFGYFSLLCVIAPAVFWLITFAIWGRAEDFWRRSIGFGQAFLSCVAFGFAFFLLVANYQSLVSAVQNTWGQGIKFELGNWTSPLVLVSSVIFLGGIASVFEGIAIVNKSHPNKEYTQQGVDRIFTIFAYISMSIVFLGCGIFSLLIFF